MPYAAMSSGGKDSTLALARASERGLDVRLLLNVYDRASARVRFHGVRQELIVQQSVALGIELLSAPSTPEAFEAVFLSLLTRARGRGLTGIVFGNIHLEDVRGWYEQRVRAAGLEHVEPLWGEDPAVLAWEFVEQGYRAIITSADLSLGVSDLVGRELAPPTLRTIACREDVDLCGERGEYHTFVSDGPIFRHPVEFTIGELVELDGHRFVDLLSRASA